MISVRQAWQPVRHRATEEPTDPVTVILSIGLAAEVILPWAVIWLSDLFFFDVPVWSHWVIFGGPPALSLLAMAMLINWDLRTWSKQSVRVRVSAGTRRA